MLRHTLREFALTDDGRGKNRVGGRNAGSAHQTFQPIEGRDHPPDEQAGYQPAPGHDGHQEQEDGLPVALHVGFGQLDADGEALNDQDDSGTLQRDFVNIPPAQGVEKVGRMRAEDDAAQGGNGGFTNVQLLLHEE